MGITAVCSVVPAWHVSRAGIDPRRAAVAAPRAWRTRRTLVVAQISMSCVLVIVAGLLARTVSALLHEDHGFRPEGALEAKLVLSDTPLHDGAPARAYVTSLLERVRSMPGVQSAGVGTNLPPRTPPITITMRLIGPGRDETRSMKVGTSTPGYLPALGARFIAGRDFEETDGRVESPGVILSASAARFHFPDGQAVGRTIGRLPGIFGIKATPRVVGVVADMKYEGLDAPSSSALYLPWTLRPMGTAYLIVRSTGDAQRLVEVIRAAGRSIDAAVAIPEVQTVEQVMAQSIANRRVRAMPAVGFGVLSLCVAFIGVLATLSTLVAERRRDLAIRAALGASPNRLTRGIMGQGLVLIVLGLGAGLGLAGAAARGLSSFFYGVSPYDATTFVGTALLVGGGALLLTYAAALGARSADPIVALRAE
jgi:predicted permease